MAHFDWISHKWSILSDTCSLEDGLFSCDNSTRCVPLSLVCDGIEQCVDGQDEQQLCGNNKILINETGKETFQNLVI